ncbi:MAG: hypothetical protein E6Q36_05720 [Chryseobacterium sp.]|nr:MAG: hypothetical protein E6Q36_05720 [Chryseobacterium sp.]
MDLIERIAQWQKERQLDKMTVHPAIVYKQITDEILEAFGLQSIFGAKISDVTPAETASELADIIVYVVGYIMQLGFDPNCIVEEVVKKIESRQGHYDPAQNKWIKTNQGSYQPNYERCKC